VINAVLKGKALTIGLAVAVLIASIWPARKLGHGPPPHEGRTPPEVPQEGPTRHRGHASNRLQRQEMTSSAPTVQFFEVPLKILLSKV
jgi:hypothetical protein